MLTRGGSNRVRDEFGTYHDIFASTFQHSIELAAVEKGITQEEDAEYKLTIESYDTKNGDFPKEERVKQADGLLITGSGTFALALPSLRFVPSFASNKCAKEHSADGLLADSVECAR